MYMRSYLKFNLENDIRENLTDTEFYSTTSVLILY